MATVLDIQSELNEISSWLSNHGCDTSDHHIILEKCKADQDIHLRYLNNARYPRTDKRISNRGNYT